MTRSFSDHVVTERFFRRLLLVALAAVAFGASVPLWGPFYDATGVEHALGIVAVVSVIVSAVIAARRPAGRRIGALMLLLAIIFSVATLTASAASLLSAVGWLVEPLSAPVLFHIVVTFPDGRLRPGFERGLVAFAYAQTAAFGGTIVIWDPADSPYCQRVGCAENPLLVSGDRALGDLLATVQQLLWIVLLVLVVVVLVRRWRRSSRPERRARGPVYAAFAANIASGFAILAIPVGESAIRIIAYFQAGGLILIAVALAVGLMRATLARAAVGDLVVRVSRSPSLEALERDVAVALGDPSARLSPVRADVPALVAAHGSPGVLLDGRPERAATVVQGSDGPLGELVVDASISRDHPELVAAVTAAAALALENQRLHDEVRLSREIPPGLAERLQREGRAIGETETLEVTVLMSDVRGYSTLAERADPQLLARQLQEHRTAMNRAIGERGGTVMQFVGDAVFAVFGAPLPHPDHAASAVYAALDMHRAQERLNEEWSCAGLPPFGLGIGLTTGLVAAALLGSEEHLEYSVVGDVVNLAQRLQQWADVGEVVIDHATYAAVAAQIRADALPPATVKGRAGAVAAYRVRPDSDAPPAGRGARAATPSA